MTVVGVLGGGQLARMLALAGLPLGMRFRFLDPSSSAVAGHLGELLVGAYEDEQVLARFVNGVDLVTFEFENVPARTASWLLDHVAVYPHPRALELGQDRLFERRLFEKVSAAVPDYIAATTADELAAAAVKIGAPCVIKTRRLGYDGKGQQVIRAGEDPAPAARAAFAAMNAPGIAGFIVERFVPFDRELSILTVRGRDGTTAFYPLVENVHRQGILRRSRAPAPAIAAGTQREAERIAAAVVAELDYVGVLAIELFEFRGRLLVNEMAPRVHNSGHWTIEGSECSQFENHLRAVAGLPIGPTRMVADGYATMVNLIGELPPLPGLLAVPGCHAHVYGKEPRPARKLGHVTFAARERATVDAGAARVEEMLTAIDAG